MVDIFALPIEWADDAHPASYRDLDGQLAVWTVDRIIYCANNALAGHDPWCGMPDCDVIESPTSAMHREMASVMGKPLPEPVMMHRCIIEGPTSPEREALNDEIDAQIEADFPGISAISQRFARKRKLGFDISRQSDDDV